MPSDPESTGSESESEGDFFDSSDSSSSSDEDARGPSRTRVPVLLASKLLTAPILNDSTAITLGTTTTTEQIVRAKIPATGAGPPNALSPARCHVRVKVECGRMNETQNSTTSLPHDPGNTPVPFLRTPATARPGRCSPEVPLSRTRQNGLVDLLPIKHSALYQRRQDRGRRRRRHEPRTHHTICAHCSGGRVLACSECTGAATRECPECDRAGADCQTCHGIGRLACANCHSTGSLTCTPCEGRGIVTTSREDSSEAAPALFRSPSTAPLQPIALATDSVRAAHLGQELQPSVRLSSVPGSDVRDVTHMDAADPRAVAQQRTRASPDVPRSPASQSVECTSHGERM